MTPAPRVGAAVGAALLVPASAQAHVTLNPREAEAGGFTQLDVRVPTERDDAATTKVDLQLPAGFAFASYEPRPGWSVKVIKSKLATPVKTDDGEVTEQVTRVVWTGTGNGIGKIGPGQFMNFPLSVQIPGKAGDTLTFKALQTYSDGEVVRWIGDESSDNPAPTVSITAAAEEGGHVAATPAESAARRRHPCRIRREQRRRRLGRPGDRRADGRRAGAARRRRRDRGQSPARRSRGLTTTRWAGPPGPAQTADPTCATSAA